MFYPTPQLIEKFKNTKGAFSVAEAIALYNIVLSAPRGTYCEFGTHKGKSTTMIAAAARRLTNLYLVEPEFVNEEWKEQVKKHVLGINKNIFLTLDCSTSLNVIPKINKISFCLIDSGNHDEMVMQEVMAIQNNVLKHGIVAFHDYKNQFTYVEKAYNFLIDTGKFTAVPIDWNPILNYTQKGRFEDGNDTWHNYPELKHSPNFLGAVIKN